MIKELHTIALFDDCTDDELEWLVANCSELRLEKGEYFGREGDPEPRFYVVLTGELQITRTINGERMVVGTTPRGIMGGEGPLLMGGSYNVDAQAISPTRLMIFDRKAFRAIFTNCPTLGARILRTAAERSQGLASMVKQHEKMAALGRLSAGLAHELNNPAAAARRASSNLRETLPALSLRTLELNALGLTTAQLKHLTSCQDKATELSAEAAPLSTLDRADREEQIGGWLEDHDVPRAWELASTFVEAGFELDELEEIAGQLTPQQVGGVFVWLHEWVSANSLLEEVELSVKRVSELVTAIKSYTYMDQGKLQDVDLKRGLDDTLTVLSHKVKGVKVVKEFDPELPLIAARGGELNQVWTNLIDNALDAMHGNGTLRLITRCENDFAMVEVADDGPGIPAEVLPRIFEPFFTTKGVGAGTGLGLDIAYRIIKQHSGTIDVQSRPGLTRFIVRLPVHTNGH